MRVVCLGQPFFRHHQVLARYRGPHEIRTLGTEGAVDYRFDPLQDNWQAILDRMGGEWTPDLALCWFPENDPPPLGIEDSPIPTVAMAGDWNLFYPCLAVNLGRYDLVLSDKKGVEVLRGNGIAPHHLFPLYAHDPRYHCRYGAEKDIDILYVGSLNLAHYRKRGVYLERIAKMSDRYHVVLADGVFDEDYGRLLDRAKIVFNNSVRGEVNLRLFETMACGSLAFLEDTNHEVRDSFEDGRDVVLYSEEDLEERLTYYLQNPDAANAIVETAHSRISRFAPEQRIDRIIDWALAQPGSGRPFRNLPESERVYQTALQYASTLRKSYGPIKTQIMGDPARIAPDDPRTWTLVAKSLLFPPPETIDSKRVKLALTMTQRAHKLSPNSAPYALNAATAAEWLSSDAEPYLRATLAANSLEGERELLGWFAFETWMRWLHALPLHETTLSILHAEAHARLGHLERARGNGDSAVEHFAQALELDPENTTVSRPLAEAYWEAGRQEEALRVLEICQKHFPFTLEIRERLATWYMECHMHQEAEDCIHQACLLFETLQRSRASARRETLAAQG